MELEVLDVDSNDISASELGSFLPRYLFPYCASATKLEPCIEKSPAAVLFIDISGFSKLGQLVSANGVSGVELLTEILNSYFGKLIDVIDENGGDVVKIAGDALIVTWLLKTPSSSTSTLAQVSEGSNPYACSDMQEAFSKALHCALKCVKIRQKYRFQTKRTSTSTKGPRVPSSTLSVHCAIAIGTVELVHCGGVNGLWEYFMAGDSLFSDLRVALHTSSPGEIVLSKTALNFAKLMLEGSLIPLDVEVIATQDGIGRIQEGFSKNTSISDHKSAYASVMHSSFTRNGPDSMGGLGLGSATSSIFPAWIKQLKVPPKTLALARSYLQTIILGRLKSGCSVSLPEIRTCTIVFLNLIDIRTQSEKSIEFLQKTVQLIQTMSVKYQGFLRQLLMDDKGCVAILGFGIPGHEYSDGPQRGLCCAVDLYYALRDSGLENSIGCATGLVYCGDVGSSIRREYSLVGDTVNFAAHLMSQKQGVLCDYSTYEHGIKLSDMDFQKVEKLRIKGKTDPVTAYKTLRRETLHHEKISLDNSAALVRRGQTSTQNYSGQRGKNPEKIEFPGSQTDVQLIKKFLLEVKRTQVSRNSLEDLSSQRVLIMNGDSGSGKSSALKYISDLCREMAIGRVTSRGLFDYNIQPYLMWKCIIEKLSGITSYANNSQKRKMLLDCIDTPMITERAKALGLSETFGQIQMIRLVMPVLGSLLDIGMQESMQSLQLSYEQRNGYLNLTLGIILENIANKAATVFLIDDADRMDPQSFSLLSRLCRQKNKMFFILFKNPSKPHNPDVDFSVLREFTKTELLIPPFTESNLGSLLKYHHPIHSFSLHLIHLLYERGKGNPRYTLELFSHLRDNEWVVVEEIESNASLKNKESIPESISLTDMYRARVNLIPQEAQLVLKTACVLGCYASVAILKKLVPIKVEQKLTAAIEKCVQTGFLHIDVHYEDHFILLDQVREACYETIIEGHRRYLHQVVANHMERFYAPYHFYVSPAIAIHYQRAEAPVKALEHLDSSAYFLLHCHLSTRALKIYEQMEVYIADTNVIVHPHIQASWMLQKSLIHFSRGALSVAKELANTAMSLMFNKEGQGSIQMALRVQKLKFLGSIFRMHFEGQDLGADPHLQAQQSEYTRTIGPAMFLLNEKDQDGKVDVQTEKAKKESSQSTPEYKKYLPTPSLLVLSKERLCYILGCVYWCEQSFLSAEYYLLEGLYSSIQSSSVCRFLENLYTLCLFYQSKLDFQSARTCHNRLEKEIARAKSMPTYTTEDRIRFDHYLGHLKISMGQKEQADAILNSNLCLMEGCVDSHLKFTVSLESCYTKALSIDSADESRYIQELLIAAGHATQGTLTSSVAFLRFFLHHRFGIDRDDLALFHVHEPQSVLKLEDAEAFLCQLDTDFRLELLETVADGYFRLLRLSVRDNLFCLAILWIAMRQAKSLDLSPVGDSPESRTLRDRIYGVVDKSLANLRRQAAAYPYMAASECRYLAYLEILKGNGLAARNQLKKCLKLSVQHSINFEFHAAYYELTRLYPDFPDEAEKKLGKKFEGIGTLVASIEAISSHWENEPFIL